MVLKDAQGQTLRLALLTHRTANGLIALRFQS
jgi:hypothetical protein